jgi:hypothetical protein
VPKGKEKLNKKVIKANSNTKIQALIVLVKCSKLEELST